MRTTQSAEALVTMAVPSVAARTAVPQRPGHPTKTRSCAEDPCTSPGCQATPRHSLVAGLLRDPLVLVMRVSLRVDTRGWRPKDTSRKLQEWAA